jgi:hypothetical protein
MPLLLGGAIASVFGIIGLVVWWESLAVVLKGTVPILLLMGGVLAIYVGYDDFQEKLREEKRRQDDKLDRAREEIETIRAQAELYREELERIKETQKAKGMNT